MHRVRAIILAGALATVLGLSAHATGILATLEADSVDLRFSAREDRRPDDVVIVAIDDITFSDLPVQWPFPRRMHAKVIDRLHAAGAKEIVFDIQFTEPTAPAQDLALYDAIARAGGAVLATSETDGGGGHRILGGERSLRAIGATGAAANLPDEDKGVVRRFTYDIGGLPTIATTVARRLGRPVPPERFDADGTAWIDFHGGPGTVPTVSYSDVYRGRVDPSAIAGRVALVGASAPTLQDVHATSTARRKLMSGPEIQANAIWTALHGLPMRSPPWWAAILAVGALALAVPAASLLVGPLLASLGGLVLGAGYVGAVVLAFEHHVILTAVAPLVTLVLSMGVTAAAWQLLEGRERRRVSLHNELLEQAVRERTADLDRLQLEIIERLGQAVDSRDEETGEHIARIGGLSHRLALAAGMHPDRAEMVRRASAMHDVGKIAIPDAILQKPGRLTPAERRIMETHTTAGARILAGSRSELVQMAEVIALTHHERWDGTGYPRRIAGADIPYEGRIVAICDVFDALISRRPYKKPWPEQEALAEIERCAGAHFDPQLAATFLSIMGYDAHAGVDTTDPARKTVRAA